MTCSDYKKMLHRKKRMIIKTGLKGHIRSIRNIKEDTAFVMHIISNQHQYGKKYVRHYGYYRLHRKSQ